MYTQCKSHASRRWSRFFFSLWGVILSILFMHWLTIPLHGRLYGGVMRSGGIGERAKDKKMDGEKWWGEDERVGRQGEGTKQRKEKGSGERERGKKLEDVTEGGGEARYISWDLIAASSPCHRSSCLRLNEAPSVMGSLHPSSLTLLKSTTQRRRKEEATAELSHRL